jgi:folylpolyglutamate synthase/dihydropteroate synthase
MSGCDYVILQGLSGKDYSIDAVCAPYDLIVMPSVYESSKVADRVKILCDAIKRGTREVISGNQKSDIYNRISNACAVGGIRLYIPVKAQFELIDITSRSLGFKYGEKDGYTMKSPSCMLRDCAMTVIESALAIRRSGKKLPWSSIKTGLASAVSTGAFDMLSVSPRIITDSAKSAGEVSLLLKTCDEIWGRCDKVLILTKAETEEALDGILAAFTDRMVEGVIVVSENGFDTEGIDTEVTVLKKTGDAAKKLLSIAPCYDVALCFGSVEFSFEIKNELLKKMNG